MCVCVFASCYIYFVIPNTFRHIRNATRVLLHLLCVCIYKMLQKRGGGVSCAITGVQTWKAFRSVAKAMVEKEKLRNGPCKVQN